MFKLVSEAVNGFSRLLADTVPCTNSLTFDLITCNSIICSTVTVIAMHGNAMHGQELPDPKLSSAYLCCMLTNAISSHFFRKYSRGVMQLSGKESSSYRQ